eukprot:CAMPEP_0117673690 /NCGR_PEP_ID=MMETSP0804-20121206/14611_1 /TAXON_ID=1074897 /ORGANISM="Tetraselmis astigmatica, Strain CCMP880" /LENGTH=246 /DNA_ID=CAMNT_0005482453 /DNA_START=129 /DNA_END=866 /DNA_ORIENTATION=-
MVDCWPRHPEPDKGSTEAWGGRERCLRECDGVGREGGADEWWANKLAAAEGELPKPPGGCHAWSGHDLRQREAISHKACEPYASVWVELRRRIPHPSTARRHHHPKPARQPSLVNHRPQSCLQASSTAGGGCRVGRGGSQVHLQRVLATAAWAPAQLQPQDAASFIAGAAYTTCNLPVPLLGSPGRRCRNSGRSSPSLYCPDTVTFASSEVSMAACPRGSSTRSRRLLTCTSSANTSRWSLCSVAT